MTNSIRSVNGCVHSWTADEYEVVRSRVCNVCGEYSVNIRIGELTLERDLLITRLMHSEVDAEQAIGTLQNELSDMTKQRDELAILTSEYFRIGKSDYLAVLDHIRTIMKKEQDQ
jgi:hypothetical protein